MVLSNIVKYMLFVRRGVLYQEENIRRGRAGQLYIGEVVKRRLEGVEYNWDMTFDRSEWSAKNTLENEL